MNESPLLIVLYLGVAFYVGRQYWEDYKAARLGTPSPQAMPGAMPASPFLYLIGIAGALVILGAETWGEIALGVVDEQSDMVWYFLFASLAAGVVEEVIFRGYLVIDGKGRFLLVGSCLGFSLLFALIHGHLWDLEDGFVWTLTAKGWFSTAVLFANSLWFYALRFAPWNPRQSIFPCMVAHAVSNFGVFCVKWAQGYVLF